MKTGTRLMTYTGGALMAALLIGAAAGCGGDSGGGGGTQNAAPAPPPPPPPGSCQPSSSLSVLVTGKNVVSYVPKSNWSTGGASGVSQVNVEGTSITPALIPTGTDKINSCASNPASVPPMTVCTANSADVWLIPAGNSPTPTMLTSAGTGDISFSGGSCTNCGVAMDGVHNKAVISLSLGGAGGFQYLDLSGTPAFETAFASPAPASFGANISEDPLIDPTTNRLLSAAEGGNYEVIDVTNTKSPKFFENPADPGAYLDSSGEDCSTGIALAPAEGSDPTDVYIADLTQAKFTAGTPSGTWTDTASQIQTLSESNLSAGGSGLAVAQGTHIGIVAGEFGGDEITAIALPTKSGSGIPAIQDWVSCNIGNGFSNGYDPHTVTAYTSPNNGHAIALLANGTATTLAVVDLTAMLNKTTVPRTSGAGAGHACATAPLPTSVLSFVAVP